MTNFDIKGLIGNGNQQLETANLTKVFLKSLDSVIENDENPYAMTDIEFLEKNIEQQGLEEALTGYLNDDGTVVLYSGHRRLQALKNLYLDEKKYKYHGKDITGSVPVLIQPKVKDHNDELMKIIGANNHRDLTKEEKEKIIDLSLEVIQKKYGEGRIRHRIAELTGIKEAFIGNYLAIKKDSSHSKTITEEINAEKQSKSKEMTSKKFWKKFLKATKNLYQSSEDYLDVYQDEDPKTLLEVLNLLQAIINRLKE